MIEKRMAVFYHSYLDCIDSITSVVGKSMWVVGIFIVFLVFVLNTHLVSIFTTTAQDIFKALMWVLILYSFVFMVYGVVSFLTLRRNALSTYETVYSHIKDTEKFTEMLSLMDTIRAIKSSGTFYFFR